MAELYEKHGNLNEAMQMYSMAALRDPENFYLQASILRLLAAEGKTDAAQKQMSDLLLNFHADAEALTAVRQAMASLHQRDALPHLLEQIHQSHPEDRNIYFALADEFESTGQDAKARQWLRQWAFAAKPDAQALYKLFSLFLQANDLDGALRLLVEVLAQRPDSLRDLTPMWSDLIERDFTGRLGLEHLQKMKLPAAQEASRLYWIARLAASWNRGVLAEQSLQQACAMTPPFGPACRMLTEFYNERPDWDAA
jgi:tetratricopeptide (TPR) repeat protein